MRQKSFALYWIILYWIVEYYKKKNMLYFNGLSRIRLGFDDQNF